MKTEDETLSTQESLAIITEMIKQAKGNAMGNSVYFLLWGTVVAIANLGMFTLIQLNYRHPYIVWLIALPAWFITIYIAYRHSKKAGVTSHLDRITVWLWFSFGIVIFTLIGFGKMINFQLNPVILLFSALPTLVSGIIIKFRPLIIGGISFWIFGILCFLVGTPWQYLLGAIAVTTGYLIPGFILRNKKES